LFKSKYLQTPLTSRGTTLISRSGDFSPPECRNRRTYTKAARGKESLLHIFACGTDGNFPVAAVIFDRVGNLYGTTEFGSVQNQNAYGTVFRLSPSGGMWSETILHRFSNGKDGAEPAVQFINPNLLSSVRALVIVRAVHDYFLFSAGAANHTLRPTPDAARSAISFGLRERSAHVAATIAQSATLRFLVIRTDLGRGAV
jgi:uncharacterized repeat protein (TIGR03803 family)